jgi:UvrD/REP helicase N-terminal domain
MSSPAPPVNNSMNLAQQEAVNYLHGPCLVLAGAGSGKTRVITHKIGRLIQSGMPANRIAAITFTNKAAAEMRERAKGLIGKAAKDVLICTFHALGVRMHRAPVAMDHQRLEKCGPECDTSAGPSRRRQPAHHRHGDGALRGTAHRLPERGL